MSPAHIPIRWHSRRRRSTHSASPLPCVQTSTGVGKILAFLLLLGRLTTVPAIIQAEQSSSPCAGEAAVQSANTIRAEIMSEPVQLDVVLDEGAWQRS